MLLFLCYDIFILKTILLKKLKSNRYIIFLSVLSVILLISVVRYGLRTFKVPEWDEQHYMRMSTEFYRLIKYHLSINIPYEMLQVVPFRQLGYPLLIVPFFFVFGLSHAYFWGIFTNGLLYIATIFGIFFTAKNFLSEKSAFLASFIFAFYGWTLLHLHLAYSETASSVFIIWTIFFLIKSNFFQDRKYSFFFGVFLGLGLFVRWIIILYLLFPLVYVFYQLFKKQLLKKKILFNIGFSFLISFVISFYQYFQNSYWMFDYFYVVRVGGPVWKILPQDERNPLSLYAWTFYLNTFAQLGIYFFILILIGVFLALKKKGNLKLILLAAISGYLFTALAPLKGERYIVPIFPYLAILSASVFDFVKSKKFNLFLLSFTVILALTSFLGSVWGRGPMRQSLASFPLGFSIGQLDKIYLTTYSRPPYIYKISGKEILDYIAKDAQNSGIENAKITKLFYYRPLDEPLMSYNLYNYEKPFEINDYLGTIINEPGKEAPLLLRNLFKNSDYILIKSGQRTDDFFSPVNYHILKSLIELSDSEHFIEKDYEKKAVFWIYQDSSQVTVLRKKNRIDDLELERLGSRFAEILVSQIKQ